MSLELDQTSESTASDRLRLLDWLASRTGADPLAQVERRRLLNEARQLVENAIDRGDITPAPEPPSRDEQDEQEGTEG